MSTRRYNVQPKDVQEARFRRITTSRYSEVTYRLWSIEQSFNQLNDKQEELYRYFPTALFSCLETWVRMAICDLVNFGEPFRSNARALMKDKKIDYDTMIEIDKESFTVGDIVSFSQSVSKLHHIFNIMDVLLGVNFRDSIKESRDRLRILEKKNSYVEPIIDNVDDTCWWVKDMIRLRDVFCHETAANEIVKKSKIEQYIKHTNLFIYASHIALENAALQHTELTQFNANTKARRTVTESRELLNETIKRLSKLLSSRQKQLFDTANETWERFLSASVKMEGLAYMNEQVRANREANVQMRLIDQRVEQLDHLYNIMSSINE